MRLWHTMERYPRLFILASLIYLSLGVTVGALMAVGVINPFAWRFVHFHLNFLGFLTMIVSGVAYHVIPRFTGRSIARPRLIAAHFWLANVGLLGMILTRGVAASAGGKSVTGMFPLFSVIAALGAWLFVWNLFPLLVVRYAREFRGRVSPQMKVSEVLARWPSSLEVFRHWGFAALAKPAARVTFARLVTLEKACRIHKVDLKGFIEALNAVVEKREIPLPLVAGEGGRPEGAPGRSSSADRVQGDTRVRDILRGYPGSRAVLERFFGADCFSCPGQMQETLAESAALHGVDPEELIAALDKLLVTTPKKHAEGRVP